MHIRDGVLKDMALASRTSLVLGFKFLVLALACQSLALASDYQSLALASALDCQSLALSLEVVLDIALNIQIFWQPTQHSHKRQEVLRFHS